MGRKESNQTKKNLFVGYQTAYSQLAFAGKKDSDFLSETVPQLKMGLAKGLEKMSAAHPGKVNFLFNSFKPNGISRSYQLDQSISALRVV